MRKNSLLIVGCALVLVAGASVPAWAEATPEEIAKLGNELTPLGGTKAGNADGSIPAWTGGITTPPASYVPGEHYVNPYADDKILFTITSENVDRYADKLTVGQKALFETYPDTYEMNVYPTHRSASFPQRIYDMTKQIAATAHTVDNGYGVEGAINGIPFPIPKTGVEGIWNHILRYRSDSASRDIGQAAPTRGGSYTMVQFHDEFYMLYSMEGKTEADLNNKVLYFKQEVMAPARLAGGILLVQESMNQVKEHRQAWLYNPGQRRVRRAPNVAYDNPGTAADAMRTSDQFDMYNGAVDRYDWELVGKKEIYIPYNSYKLQDPTVKNKEILTPLHINQQLARYELHRVWVVDATLKEGARHIYKRRTFYLDEDSWQIVAVDAYDKRDQLWRVSEAHVINYYNVPAIWTALEVHTDLQAGRYLAIGLNSENPPYKFDIKRTAEDYTPAALRRAGKR
ncbi:MAG: DUF1329 domain-containing protein [Acidobacteria bacterium]|nr:DUF1329 domain-containing protein [Candidatus Sulfomarinibacter sp. MAG AM2]